MGATRRYAGKKWQGEDEEIAYSVDTTIWGGYTSDVAVTLLDGNGDDVSGTHLSGAAAVVGNVITTPLVVALGVDIRYTLQILWVCGANTFEAYCYIIGEV